MNAFSDERVRRRLWIVLVCYETAIVSVILAAGANIAIVQGGTIAGAAPLIVIGLAESLRIPLAGWSTQLGLAGRALAALALIAIAVASFDGLALVFSIFIDNRLTNVLQAQHQVEIAQRAADTVASDTAAFVAEVREVDGAITALAASRPQPPTASNKTCTWKNQRVPCGPDTTAAAAYASAQKAYDARLANLEAKRAASQAKVDGARGRTAAPEVLAEARRKLDDELMLSPFHRLVASLYGVRPSDLTEEQFGKVKRFAIIGLAGTFATLSMLVSIVVHLQPRSERGGKLARAIRAMVAARRKTLRRLTETIKFQDRVIIRWVPFDPKSGLRIKPDGEPGEVVTPTWAQKS